jgi:V/A-type H+/Na+-transporting ATPase subunit E
MGDRTMAYEDLLKSVEESAEEKELELRKKALLAIDAIRERAKKQAVSVRQAYLDEAEKSITTERNKLLYITKAECKELLIKTRKTVFERAFREAGSRLATLRADKKYPHIFKKLLIEAAGTMGGAAFCIHVDPRDEELCRKTISELQIAGEIQTDLETAGGVVLSQPGETVVISNTVESRLLRAQEHERHVIHTILSGD